MPKLPSWLANTVEKLISNKIYEVSVAETKMLSNDIKLVTFKGDFFDVSFTPGLEILFRVNANEYRHYTVSRFNREAQTFEVIFYLNRQGPGNVFATQIRTGDQLRLIVDQAHVGYKDGCNQHFFFGDETSIGLYESFAERAVDRDEEYFGILELDEHNFEALDRLKLLIDAVEVNKSFPAEKAIHWMENMHPKCWEMWKYATFYLTGRAKSVKQFKKYLKQRGVSFKQIITMPYWEVGKVGGA